MTEEKHKEQGTTSHFFQEGFTLIELLVVMAVGLVLTTGGFFVFSQVRDSQNLNLTAEEITALVRSTQKRSITQESGFQWGIRFSNVTSSVYSIWSGSDYDTGTVDQEKELRRGIVFGNPPQGSFFDIVFSAVSGVVPNKQIISLRGGKNSNVTDIIISTLGKITKRPETDLVGYWHFDEGTSTIVHDTTGYGSNGSIQGAPAWDSGSSCKAGECLDFNGSSDFITVTSTEALDVEDSVSVSAWLYTNGTSRQSVVAMGDGNDYTNNYQIFIDTQATFSVGEGSYATYASKAGAITSGSWYHIVGTFDGSTAKVYVNGSLGGQDTFSGTRQSGGSLRIGSRAYSGSPQWYFNGIIDEIRIYDSVLSEDEILDMYNDLK